MPARPSLGLYFNDNLIEISQVSNDGMSLVRYNSFPLPTGLVVNGDIKNRENFVQILRQLLATAKPNAISEGEDVVIGVNDSRVFLREFSLQNIPGNLDDAIEYQVRTLLPVLPTGVVTDWQIIGRSTEGQIEVLLAAIPNEIIEEYISVCRDSGLRVVAIEPAVFANIRIIGPDQLQGKNQLVVYFGETFAVFSYVTSGNPRFSDFMTQAELDKNGDISKTIQAYINFANSKHPNRLVTEVIISGSRQEIDSITNSLKSQNFPAIKAVSRLARTNVVNHSLLHTAHGLSMKTLDLGPGVNLLPIDNRLNVIRERGSRSWGLVLDMLIIFTLVGCGLLFYLYRDAITKKGDLTVLKQQYDTQLNLPESQNLSRQTDNLNRVSGQLVTLRSVTGGEENLLKRISSITPTGIVLTSFVVNRTPESEKMSDPGTNWLITGTAESRQLVLGFYSSLIEAPEFANGRLYFGSLEKEIGLTFRIASPTK